jgi:hypothetical protein
MRWFWHTQDADLQALAVYFVAFFAQSALGPRCMQCISWRFASAEYFILSSLGADFGCSFSLL